MTRYVETITDVQMAHPTCVGCDVPTDVPDPIHAWSCPTVTDLWLAGPREIDEGMTCLGCGHVFELNDVYTGKDITCLTCAAREAGQL